MRGFGAILIIVAILLVPYVYMHREYAPIGFGLAAVGLFFMRVGDK